MMEGKEEYIKAGKIAKKVLELAKRIVKPNVKYVEIYEKLTEEIYKNGGKLAFPVNISENEVAAHDSAYINDERRIKEDSVVKIDVGVQINGYIADTAITINFNDKAKEMVKTNEELIKEISKKLYYGMKAKEIAEIVEEFMKEKEYKVISNLSGHLLGKYNLHAGITISNVKNNNEFELKEVAIAVEPFLTLGRGYVIESKKSPIYMLISDKLPRSTVERKILSYIKEEFKSLPFSEVEIFKKFGPCKVYLSNMVKNGILYNFNVLKENNLVSQFEHTFLFTNGEVICTTC